jgi:hypothetical protein
MVSIVMSLNVPWPSNIRSILVGVSSVISVSGHSDSIHCSTGNQSIAAVFYTTLLATVVLPFVFVFVTWIYWFVFVPVCPQCGCTKGIQITKFCDLKVNPFRSVTEVSKTPKTNTKTKYWKSNRDGWIVTNVYFIYTMFPSVIRMTFETFQCKTVCGVLYMAKDDKEICWLTNSRHLSYALIVAVPSLVLYLLVLPVITLVYLRAHRNVLTTDHKLILRFGLVFSGYARNRWYWEAVVIFRKIFLIVIVTFGQTSQSQLHYALGALIVVLYLQERGQPFTSHEGKETGPPKIATGNAQGNWLKILKLSSAAKGKAAASEKAQNEWLHLMEVASLLVLVTMVWVSVFFTLNDNTCQNNSSALECTVLSIVVLASNVIFFVICSVSCIKSYEERTHNFSKLLKVGKQSVNAIEMVSGKFKNVSANAAIHDNITMDVALDLDDLNNNETKISINPMKSKQVSNDATLRKQQNETKKISKDKEETTIYKDKNGRQYSYNGKTRRTSWLDIDEKD